MDKKKIILLGGAVLLIAILTFVTLRLMKQSGRSITELIEFNIADTSTVDKIIITDPFSNKIELVRTAGKWTDSEGTCVTQENVHFILEAFKSIEFKGYLTDNSQQKFINLMSGQHTKVEIHQNGEWLKTWYIGPSSSDHYGQIMLLDDARLGKSDIPVMMKLKGTHGIIEPRFFADKRKWMCTNIFALTLDKISRIDLKFNDEPQRSFTVTKKGQKLDVYQQGRKLPRVDTVMIYRYLQNYKKVHFELANFELNAQQIDSLKRSTPFAVMTVDEVSGKSTKLRMFRIKSDLEQRNEFGAIVKMDMNKFWCELPNGELVKCQYFVFNELLLGHVYFPFDMSGIRTE
jgi:hypothetical protein